MYTGGCLCGKVRYEVEKFFAPPAHCHCATCRKRQGTAMSTNAPVLVEHFHILTGEDALNAFESSPGKKGYFCAHCGSHIYAKREDIPAVVLRIGCLDDGQTPPSPTTHIWRSDAAAWFDPKMPLPELPEGRQS